MVCLHVECRGDEMSDLLDRLIENDFLEAASDLFPFALCRLVYSNLLSR